MDTLRELLKKTVAVLIVITIITSRLLFAGFGLITYAIDSLSTSNENVEILAYFVDEQGEKVVNIEQKVDKTLVLKIDVTTKNEEGQGGYFDGNIEIANANFKLKDDSEIVVHVNAGETKTIEREIEYLPAENMYEGYLERDASITVRGTYVNSIGNFDVEGTATTKVKWISEENTNASISAEILTNKTYENGKKVLQVLVNSMLENSSYPVKHDHLEIDFPVEAQNIKVHKRVATNVNEGISYNTNEGKTIIDMENSIDPLVITYELPENIDLENATLNATGKLTLYDQKEVEATTQLLIDNEEKDGSLTNLLIEKEKMISKGKIYAGEEREYSSATRVYIDNIEPITNIQINENKSVFVDDTYEEIELNSNYINSRISKTEFDRLLGEEGYITIKDQDENIIANINKDTAVDENGNIVINYGEDTKNIIIITSKPVSTGIMTIINNKKIVENKTREEVEKLSYIKEQNEVNGKIAEGIINLKETESNVKITTENSTISTLSNEKQNLRIGIKLDTSEESKELFKNPKLTLTLPREITELEIEQSKALYKNGLEIKNAKLYKNENGNYAMDLAFEGEQKSYDTNGGTEIYIYLKVKADKLTPTKTSTINLTYTNDIKNVSKEVTSAIKFESQNGLMVYTEANNVSTIQGEEIETKLEMGKETKEVGTKTVLINNYEKELNNVTITGEIKDNTFKMTLNRIINSKNAKVQYSKDGQNWTENSNEATQYKITIDKINAAEKVEIYSIIGIDQNLGYNQTGKIIEKIEYKEDEVEQIKTRTIVLKTEETLFYNRNGNLGTEQVTNLESGITTKIETTSGNLELSNNDEIYEGQTIRYKITVVNNTNNDLENLKIKATQTNGKVWNYIEVTGFNPAFNEETHEHYYDISDESQIEFNTIERLAKGESAVVQYEAVPSGTGATFGMIDISTENQTISEQVKTIENTIKPAEIQIYTIDTASQENLWYEESIATYTTHVKNMTNTVLNNVTLKMSFSSNLTINGEYGYFDFGENDGKSRFNFVSTEKNSNGETVITVNITEIRANEDFRFFSVAKTNKKSNSEKIENTELFMQAIVNSNTYSSNVFNRGFYKVNKDIEASIKIESQNPIVKSGETFTIVTDIKNKEADKVTLEIVDGINPGLEIEKVTLIKNQTSVDKTSSIKDGTVYLFEEVEGNSAIQIRLDARINTSAIPNKTLKHKQTIVDFETYKEIGLEVDIETNKNVSSSNGNSSGENGGSENGESGNSGSNSGTTGNGYYIIKGTAWLDSNENGERETTEQRIENMTVRAINTNKGTLVNTTYKTNSDGTYSIRLEKGNYIIIFMYDNNKYKVTTYQANGISSDTNSDVVTRTIKIGNETNTVAATDILNLNTNLNNIDIGLVENKKFDLKLEKFVKQIVVTNSKGTKTYTQDAAETLAKIEIPSRVINGTNVVITYTFKITNVGDVEGYASNIVDYLPSSLTFKEGVNKNWYKSGDKIYNTSLANTIIKPGETKELTLTVTKTMTKTNTGLINNKAEIEESKNAYNLIDKTPDNASADVLIGISTGLAKTIIISLVITTSLGCVIAYLVLKKQVIKI